MLNGRWFKGKAFGVLVTMTLVVLLVVMIPEKAYAGGNNEPCGNNLDFDYGSDMMYIQVVDKMKDFTGNKMNDYGIEASPWSNHCGDIFTTLYMDYGVFYIGENAFEDMTKLETVYIPDSVQEIGDNAFKGCSNIKTVYYGGTEAEWYRFTQNISNNTNNNSYLIYADNIECLDKGELTLDLFNEGASMVGEELFTLRNTLSWLTELGYVKKQDEPVEAYDVDKDGTNDFYEFVDGMAKSHIKKMDGSDLNGYNKPFRIDSYNYVVRKNKGYLYDYCINQFTECKSFYSSITLIFNKDMGELELDMRDGTNRISDSDMGLLSTFLSIACDGYLSESGTGEKLIDYSVDSDIYYIDVDLDGKTDLEVKNDGDGYVVYSSGTLKENCTVSFADKTDFYNHIIYIFGGSFYSSLRIKVKDDVTKVEKVPATCEKDGTEEYWKSTDNDNIYADADATKKIDKPKVIKKTGHDWGEWKVVKIATEKEEGLEERVCKNDPTHKETRKIPKLTPPDKTAQMGEDGTPVGAGASDEAAEAAITNYSAEEDMDGTVFTALQAKASKVTKNSIKLTWKSVPDADTYVIYANKCGTKNKYLRQTTVNGTSFTAKKVAGAKLKKGNYYKFMIVALDKDSNVISTSKTIHAATTGGKVGNDKSVVTKAKKNKVSVKVGKTFKLKAKTKPVSKKLKVKKHRAVKYESTDTSVAVVSSKGVIKGTGKGSCIVYAYAQNGVAAKIKVTVK